MLLDAAFSSHASLPLRRHRDFYNLELKDTNVVDHNTHDYSPQGVRFEIVDEQK